MKLEAILRAAFESFALQHQGAIPHCREREFVSRFAFGHLVPRCCPGDELFDPRQIGIEAAVPQCSDKHVRRHPDVCKDLVIWPQPDQTCWDKQGLPTRFPLAVLEWKSVNRFDSPRVQRQKVQQQSESDLRWLEWLTTASPMTIGYFVLVQPLEQGVSVTVTQVTQGIRNSGWFPRSSGECWSEVT